MEKIMAVPIGLKDIKIKNGFLGRYIPLVKNVVLEYQWNVMNDMVPKAPKSHCIENFRIAAGESEGEFYGMVFQDTDLAKWLEAAAYTMITNPDKELSDKIQSVVELIGKAQCKDGYLNTYFTIKAPELRWKNLREGHELYTAGHFMEAAVACEEAGNGRMLEIMCKMADLICEHFGPEENKCHGYPGHPEVELALVRLYRATRKRKYLEMAKYFLDVRGCDDNYFLEEMKKADFEPIFNEMNNYEPIYSQSHLPIRKQKTAEGHAVRAVYLYSAMADIAYECKDEELLECCKTLWNNITQCRMYITGSIGSSGYLERFTTDYDLPNTNNYSESCASIGLMMFGIRMAQITREASYVDIVERALYNTVLAGIAMDGKSFFYVNPLEVWPKICIKNTSMDHVKPTRQKWFGVACCPPNIARTLASLGKYIYMADMDTLYINLFVSGELHTKIAGKEVWLEIETNFPVEGHIVIHVKYWEHGLKLAIRVPAYADNFSIYGKDGEKIGAKRNKGFVYIEKVCGKIHIAFDMEAKFIYANRQVRADIGRICVMRGPLVYAFEEIDNTENLEAYYIDTAQKPQVFWDEKLLGGTMTVLVNGYRAEGGPQGLYGTAKPFYLKKQMRAIPYAFWCNRINKTKSAGEMCVWMKEWQ